MQNTGLVGLKETQALPKGVKDVKISPKVPTAVNRLAWYGLNHSMQIPTKILSTTTNIIPEVMMSPDMYEESPAPRMPIKVLSRRSKRTF